MPLVLNLEKTPSQLFSKNLVRIKLIQHIQVDLTNCKATRLDQKIQFLNQAYVVQLIAFWQDFITELARYGLRQIEAFENASAFLDKARAKLDESLMKFNTPSEKNINRLFRGAFGIPEICTSWHSEALDRNTVTATLDELLKTRHQIAHTGRTSKLLSYETNFARMRILMKAAELSERALVEQLTLRCSVRKS